MVEKRYSAIDNITNFTFGYQKKDATGNRLVAGPTTTFTICACIKHKQNTCTLQGREPRIYRGTQIIKAVRRQVKIEDVYWYRTERWNVDCFIKYLNYVSTQELVLFPFSDAIKRGPNKNPLKEQIGEIRYKEYQRFQNQLRMYKGRLKKYQSNNNPTQKTLAAMANCEVKITHFTNLLEGYTCPQTQTSLTPIPSPNLNLQPPKPEEWKQATTTWDPESLHPPKSSSISNE